MKRPTHRTISLILLIGGAVLIYFALTNSHSLSAGLTKFFNHATTDKPSMMLIGGFLAVIVGMIFMARDRR